MTLARATENTRQSSGCFLLPIFHSVHALCAYFSLEPFLCLISTSVFGRPNLLPLVPDERRRAAPDAAVPTAIVDMSCLRYCIVSKIASVAGTDPPGELM